MLPLTRHPGELLGTAAPTAVGAAVPPPKAGVSGERQYPTGPGGPGFSHKVWGPPATDEAPAIEATFRRSRTQLESGMPTPRRSRDDCVVPMAVALANANVAATVSLDFQLIVGDPFISTPLAQFLM